MQIGPYTIISHLGHGASGYVYKVIAVNTERALKASTCLDTESRRRFDREIRIAQKVHHPNVVEVYDFDMDATNPYFLMELCEGSIEGICHSLSDEDKLDYALQLCKGIKALHDCNIIHRDIKPSNVLYKSGILKVTDFSFGFFLDHNSATLTASDQVVGTPGYIAPEIFREGGHNATILSDIYSLGCTLYYIFSGGIPPEYYDRKQVPANIVAIIEKCRSNNPEDRYTSVNEVISELQALNAPVSYSSIEELHSNRTNISTAEFRKIAYDLLRIETNWANLISGIVILGSTRRKDILLNIPESSEVFLLLLEQVMEFDKYTWRQYEDIDPFVDFCSEIFTISSDVLSKQKALELSLPFAANATRWYALRTIYNSMLMKLSSEEVKSLRTFFVHYKEELFVLEREISVTLPQSIRSII